MGRIGAESSMNLRRFLRQGVAASPIRPFAVSPFRRFAHSRLLAPLH
jgi:hypothetical protein